MKSILVLLAGVALALVTDLFFALGYDQLWIIPAWMSGTCVVLGYGFSCGQDQIDEIERKANSCIGGMHPNIS